MDETYFINRENELDFLNRQYREKSAQLIVIYGRRRVGKTSLLVKFCQNRPHIYLLADLKPEKEQLRDFSAQMASELKDEMLRIQPFDTVEALFMYLAKLWSERRIVVVIDEFPYLCKINPAFSSILQKYWDTYFKTRKAFLVLCGSSIGMMEKEALAHQSPLYGRRTGDWLVTPMKFRHFLKFFPDIGIEKAILFYSLVGGIAEYIIKLDSRKDIKENIIQIIRKGSPLYREIDFVVREELAEPHNYFAILKAISFGKNKQNEIVNYTGLDKGMVSKYLSVLENLQLIKRIAPITENIEKTRKSIYVICDNYFRFWFRFCFPFKSLIEEGKEQALFEEVCKEALSEEFEKVGAWWHKGNEIDIIGVSRDKVIFCECKWTNELVGTKVLQELMAKSELTGLKKEKIEYGLFSKKGFDRGLLSYAKANKNIKLYDLKGLQVVFRGE